MSGCTPNTHIWHYDSGRSFTTEISTGDLRAAQAGPFRVCSRCYTCDQLADIHASHPESMTADLGDDIEEMLAALDSDLFPEETLR